MIGLWNTEDFSQLLEGDPTALSVRAADLKVQAVAISEAAQVLQNIVAGQMSEATTELREMAAKLQTSMSQANIRYDQTGTALSTYAVALAPIKSQASADIPALEEARGRLRTAEYASGDAERRQIFETLTNSPDDVKQDTADDLARAQRKERAAQADIDQILARLRVGVSSKDEAASAAIRAIENVIAEGADSMLDNIAQFFEGFGNLLATIGQWAAEVIKQVIDALDVIWRAILIKVFAGLLLTIAAVLLGGVLSVIGGILFGPVGGVAGFLLGAGIVSLLSSFLVNRMLSDILAPDADVHMSVHDPERESSLENAFLDANDVDSIHDMEGAPDDAGTIRIEQVLGADGITRYRVTLPSTQDWQAMAKFMDEKDLQTIQQLLTDAGASNDVDSNLALMLMPEFQTIYERAVFTAMEQAGIEAGPDGDPVMLVGFSQGGIMAGHLAANRENRYNFEAVLAAGAPIDHLTDAMPSGTQVYSIQHEGDPVPLTDGLIGQGVGELFGWQNGQRDTPTWDSIHVTAEDGGKPVVGADAHNAVYYNQSWSDYLESGGLSEAERAELEMFFASGDNKHIVTTDHTWSENDATEHHDQYSGHDSAGDDSAAPAERVSSSDLAAAR